MQSHPEIESELKSLLGQVADVIPETMAGFGKLQQATFTDGALDVRTKELIALGIAIGGACDGCIAWHNAALHKLGCSVEEIAEVAGVAIEMGGGMALHPAAKAVAGFKQFGAD
ncbi:MAG: carboxymuconolactone decarboxylase family protein [Gammaproteobacteria bacterium]